METKHVARRHSIGSLQRRRKCKLKRKNSEKKLSRSIEKIRAQIVKARAEKDSAKDAFLTQKLRDLMAKQNTAKTQVV
ncbi:hypothetical protein OIU77_022765 [Salix suchowensis]|uniref:Uncharacterized protein n=1 Tax=Salix suchowensis TaxID=1278906 RepID=A0ABQ9C1D6_9ROSI|nr:hypothetical protein OIU77_022765 [Salix suchowensis]